MPALGTGQWLDAGAADRAAEILGALGMDEGAPLPEIELRHVHAADGPQVPGAMSRPLSPFVLHATGAAPDPETRAITAGALDTVLDAAGPSMIGRECPAFCDGQTEALTTFAAATGRRLRDIATATDPDQTITRARRLYP